jgi:hypothetical protein
MTNSQNFSGGIAFKEKAVLGFTIKLGKEHIKEFYKRRRRR